MISKINLAIIGIGYVGLPLAIEFSKKRKVIAFDLNQKRVDELNRGIDKTLEVNKKEIIKLKKNLLFTSNKKDLLNANCFIITVPTPIKKNKNPDLSLIKSASKIVGECLKNGDLVIYESTVYPGCTEEFCVPILEKASNLKFNKGFYCGYSPERINPGDKKHRIKNIKKITSGSNDKTANIVDSLYKEIIEVGTHKVSSIKVAESAKIIENIQRDLNISLINELSIIFDKLQIDTEEVLKAAETKWNFIPFRPGLVGGHCIGVDPYYLTFKSLKLGYKPKVILAGRKLNASMGKYISSKLISLMKKKSIEIRNSKILIMGLTFKENCPDLRNSGVENVYYYLKKLKCKTDFYDPWADRDVVKTIYGKYPLKKIKLNYYSAIIIAVAHQKFKVMGLKKVLKFAKKNFVFYDLKNIFYQIKKNLFLNHN